MYDQQFGEQFENALGDPIELSHLAATRSVPTPAAEALRARIKAAFADVAAAGEPSLDALQRAQDADAEVTSSVNDPGAPRHWSAYAADELEGHAGLLPVLSVANWRFHLPAFLLAALEKLSQPVWETGLPGAVLFNLTYAADDRVWSRKLLDRFQSLDAPQTAAVCAFLEFVSENPHQEPLRGLDAEKALRRYWRLQERVQPTIKVGAASAGRVQTDATPARSRTAGKTKTLGALMAVLRAPVNDRA
ncbi:DUF6714 family protein [uncultured Nevskia sp.]|uniref:DUF6714 family protein n=1 Tax=uncultured Nevskia sp. TaxID=228950 RepID=UPI0025D3EB60|nr:DUF6714 family protein [uncultured Nevskia sp.]